MSGSFKDHFSAHAADYAAFRTGYPGELFDWLATLPARRGLAWDAGTGNGQAAVALAERFERVVATDPSAEQLAHAVPRPNVEYRLAAAEASGLPDGAVDLATAAQAYHWFDFERYAAEVRRVLAPGGAVAVWVYDLPRVAPRIDAAVDRLHKEIAGPYWPPERRWVDEGYLTMPFPFAEVPAPGFPAETRWTLDRLLGYLGTWSSVRRYRQALGSDPLDLVTAEIAEAWGEPDEVRPVRWPLHLRVGRVPAG